MNAVDTNVLVYFFDDDEPSKQAQARELLEALVQPASQTLLLWQVAGELLSCLRRWQSTGKVSNDDVVAHIQDVLAMFPLALPIAMVIPRSLDLTSRYSLSHWDSMLVAACLEAGVETLYTEDLDDGANYDSVKIVNPFR
jgi:predicted nucleic acid-binding protein